MEECDNKDIIRDSYLLKVKLKLPFSNFWDVEMELWSVLTHLGKDDDNI